MTIKPRAFYFTKYVWVSLFIITPLFFSFPLFASGILTTDSLQDFPYTTTTTQEYKPKEQILNANDYYRIAYQLLSDLTQISNFSWANNAQFKRSYTHFIQAMELGNLKAAYALGKIAQFQNQEESAFKFFLFGAQNQHSHSQYALAMLLIRHDLSFFNPSKAVSFFESAAAVQHADAQYQAAKIYLMSDLTIYNPIKARELLEKAAGLGHAAAQYQLGLLYAQGVGTFKTNHVIAAHWFHKAALHPHFAAMLQLGRHYEKGLGVAQNHIEAVKWWKIIQMSKPYPQPTITRYATASLEMLSQNMTDQDKQTAQLAAYGWWLNHIKPNLGQKPPLSKKNPPQDISTLFHDLLPPELPTFSQQQYKNSLARDPVLVIE